MRKLAFVMVLMMLFSTAFALETDVDEAIKRMEEIYESMGLELNPIVEMNGFVIQFKGAYKISKGEDEDGEGETVTLDFGGESITVMEIDSESMGISEEIVETHGADRVTYAVMEYMKSVYEELDYTVEENPEGISCLRFATIEDYAGMGIMFAVYGEHIIAFTVVLPVGYAEEMGYDMNQYIPDKMSEIFSGISLAA